jgi:hypothetical protein
VVNDYLRRFYECPGCGHTWAIRIPYGTLTNPFTGCEKCGQRSPPKGTLAWRECFCDDCGTGEGTITVSVAGRFCVACLGKHDKMEE